MPTTQEEAARISEVMTKYISPEEAGVQSKIYLQM